MSHDNTFTTSRRHRFSAKEVPCAYLCGSTATRPYPKLVSDFCASLNFAYYSRLLFFFFFGWRFMFHLFFFLGSRMVNFFLNLHFFWSRLYSFRMVTAMIQQSHVRFQANFMPPDTDTSNDLELLWRNSQIHVLRLFFRAKTADNRKIGL